MDTKDLAMLGIEHAIEPSGKLADAWGNVKNQEE